ILSRAVMRDYPQYYSYFGQKSFSFRGHEISNHNSLLRKMPGVDGIKTGYTNAAGYNLAASQVKDGRRLITVVLGGSSTAARDENVADLLDAGFDVLAKRKLGQNITIAANISEPEDISGSGLRPSLEQGSAEQPGLHIVLSDSQALLKGMQPLAPSADASPGSRILSAAVAETSPVDAARLRPSTLKQNVAMAANDCTPVRIKVKAAPAKKGRHSRHAKTKATFTTVTRCAPAKDVQVAVAADCTKAKKGRHHRKVACAPAEKTVDVAKVECVKAKKTRRHHKAACEPVTEVAAKSKAKADAKEDVADVSTSVAGRYLIQVGAFKSQGEAQRRLSQISQRYGSVVSSASTQVESASGNYRARFRGFSAAQAKAACHTLTAKGERCLVLSKG
ncbi:MAG: SPOR domain-containing protein, partial [Caulobacteraceae bacterium]